MAPRSPRRGVRDARGLKTRLGPCQALASSTTAPRRRGEIAGPVSLLVSTSDTLQAMTTKRPSGPPPESQRKSETTPPGRTSDLDLVRQTWPAIAPALSQRPGTMRLGSGRSVSVVEVAGEERVEIRAASGEMLVCVRLTEQGPVFSITGASLEVTAAKSLSLAAETVRVSAGKHLSLEAGEMSRMKARDVEIEAAPGAVSVRANDDVDIVGERVRLNSEDPPMPHSWEEFRARRATQGHPFSDDMPLSPVRPARSVPFEASDSAPAISLSVVEPGDGGADSPRGMGGMD